MSYTKSEPMVIDDEFEEGTSVDGPESTTDSITTAIGQLNAGGASPSSVTDSIHRSTTFFQKAQKSNAIHIGKVADNEHPLSSAGPLNMETIDSCAPSIGAEGTNASENNMDSPPRGSYDYLDSFVVINEDGVQVEENKTPNSQPPEVENTGKISEDSEGTCVDRVTKTETIGGHPVNENKNIQDKLERNEHSVAVFWESTRLAVEWYNEQFHQRVRTGGLIPIRSLHNKLMSELYEIIVEGRQFPNIAPNSWKDLEQHLNEVQNPIWENYAETFTRGIDISLRHFKERYKIDMTNLIQKKLNSSTTNSLQLLIKVTQDEYISDYCRRYITGGQSSFVDHMKVLVAADFQRILQVEIVLANYHRWMEHYFSRNICFSDEFLEDIHIKCETNARGKLTSDREHLKMLDGHILQCAKLQYLDENVQIRNLEVENIWQVLEKLYKGLMSKTLAEDYSRSVNIRALHNHYIVLCMEAVEAGFDVKKMGIDIPSVKNKLQELLRPFLKSNDVKIKERTGRIQSLTETLEVEFSERARIELEKSALEDSAFEILMQKLKNETEQKLRAEFVNLVPKEGNRHFNCLVKQLDSICTQLREGNRERKITEDEKGCEMPVLLIQFGLEKLRVAYSEDGALRKPDHSEIENFLTVLNNGKYIVGERSPEKIYEFHMKDLYKTKSGGNPNPDSVSCSIRNELVEIPVNFQFVCALIFNRILESMEKHGQFRTAVVTVPLWMPSFYRQAIKNAGTIAGFAKVFLLNETSALLLHLNFPSQSILKDTPLSHSEVKKEKLTLVIAYDAKNSSAAVYRHQLNQHRVNIITMVSNTGSAHIVLSSWRLPSVFPMGGPEHVLSKIIDTSFQVNKNIDQVIILCEKSMKKVCQILTQNKITSVTCLYPEDDTVLRGAATYANKLCQSIVQTKLIVNDQTYYNLKISDPSLYNNTLLDRQTPLEMIHDSTHGVNKPPIEFFIYETGDDPKGSIYEVDRWSFSTIMKQKDLRLRCFAKKDGICEVHSAKGVLSYKEATEELIFKQGELIRRYFKKDKEMETATKELEHVANFIMCNKDRLKSIVREQIPLEAEEALNLVCRPNATKQDILEKLMYLKKLKERHLP